MPPDQGPLDASKRMPTSFITVRDSSTTLTSTCTTPLVLMADRSTTLPSSPTAACAAATAPRCASAEGAMPVTTACSPAVSTSRPERAPRRASAACTPEATRTVHSCGSAAPAVQTRTSVTPALRPSSRTPAGRPCPAASTRTSATCGSATATRVGAAAIGSGCWPLTATCISRGACGAAGWPCARAGAPAARQRAAKAANMTCRMTRRAEIMKSGSKE